jgi:hypothetical protein
MLTNEATIAYLRLILDQNTSRPNYGDDNCDPGKQMAKAYNGEGIENGILALIMLLEQKGGV